MPEPFATWLYAVNAISSCPLGTVSNVMLVAIGPKVIIIILLQYLLNTILILGWITSNEGKANKMYHQFLMHIFRRIEK